jgi:hypothetical protein
VSCPDWTALTAHRRERSGIEPEGWREALTHLDGGCQVCREAALQADPVLVFRRLPAPAATMTEARERAEVEAVRQAVAAMRTARRLDSLETRRRGLAGVLAGALTGALTGWKRWSAAAALVLAALSVPAGDPRQDRQDRLAASGDAAIFRAGLVSEPPAAARQVGLAPVLEGVDLPGARVYHLSNDGLSVVMVVDESIDI